MSEAAVVSVAVSPNQQGSLNPLVRAAIPVLALASRLLPWRKESDANAYERFTKGAAKAMRPAIAAPRAAP